jgi:ADP-heptose:LPS heptosyltransferase
MNPATLPASWNITPKAAPWDGLRRRALAGLAKASPPSAEASPRYRAVIYEAQRLGDLLLASKVIHALLEHFGAERTALAVSPEALPLANEIFPDVPKILVPLALSWDGWNLCEGARLRRELSAFSCEHWVCLRHHRSPLASAILGWIPARERWAMVDHPWMSLAARRAEDGLFTHTMPFPFPVAQEGVPAEAQAHADLLSLVTGIPRRAAELLPAVGTMASPPPGKPRLLLAPWGSSWMKGIPKEQVEAILRQLSTQGDFSVDMIAAPVARKPAERLIRQLQQRFPGVVMAYCPTPALADVQAAIAVASAVLAADSFPGHLATAMDRPTAILAAGATPGLFGPWGRSPRQHWFMRTMPCWGCGWKCPYSRPPCLLEIPAQDVSDFLARNLFGEMRP